MSKKQDPVWLEYFSGGVPTSEYFRMTLKDISNTIDRSSKGICRINEICLIGLVAYFEAFCKDHFASILNIEPTLLVTIRQKGQDTRIDPARLIEFQDKWNFRLGFLVAENYDFGTAQKINALYSALLKVTPFSKSDAEFYDEMLRDRNLLVHHGGILTLSYIDQNKIPSKGKLTRPFFDSIVVSSEYFNKQFNFIENMAKKILKITHEALESYIANLGGLLFSRTEESNGCVLMVGR